MSIKRLTVAVSLIVLICLFVACSEQKAEEPLRLAKKEATWVKTEKVKITREEALAAKKNPETVPLNKELENKLLQPDKAIAESSVTDLPSCLAQVDKLDKIRTAVQHAGGMWHALERQKEAKPHSHKGMQIDSAVNKLIYAVRHLCETAKGQAMDDFSRMVAAMLKEMGSKEAVKKELLSRGEASADADIWIAYAESSQKKAKRALGFQEIKQALAKVAPMVYFYDELSKRETPAAEMTRFLSDAETLLKVLKEAQTTDEQLVMALNDDTEVPYHHVDQDM